MDGLSILYCIIAFCMVFAAISAYLIYRNDQDEKKQYYKYKFRKEIAKKDIHTFGEYHEKTKVNGTQDEKVTEPLPVTNDTEDTTKAALIAPVVVPLPPIPDLPPSPIDLPSPEAEPKAPTPPGPGVNTTNEPPPVVLAVGGGAAVTAAALTAAKPPADPAPRREAKEAREPKKSKNKETVSDFDDYRNASPTTLPKPKVKAPDAATYDIPQEHEVKIKATEPRHLPTVSSRDGLEF